MKKFMSVCLITSDVRGLCEFYARVLEATPEGDDSFAMFSTTGITLPISSTQLLENLVPVRAFNPVRGGSCFLEFEVEDVDQEYERLQNINVDVLKPPVAGHETRTCKYSFFPGDATTLIAASNSQQSCGSGNLGAALPFVKAQAGERRSIWKNLSC